MAGIKNKDGSINWSKVKVNPVIEAVWGETVKLNPCKNAVDEIKAFIDSQYDEAVKNANKAYRRKEFSEYNINVARASLCEDLLDFIDRIIEL